MPAGIIRWEDWKYMVRKPENQTSQRKPKPELNILNTYKNLLLFNKGIDASKSTRSVRWCILFFQINIIITYALQNINIQSWDFFRFGSFSLKNCEKNKTREPRAKLRYQNGAESRIWKWERRSGVGALKLKIRELTMRPERSQNLKNSQHCLKEPLVQ